LNWISSVFLWIYKVCCEQIQSKIVGSLLGFKLHTVYNGKISKMLPLLVYLCVSVPFVLHSGIANIVSLDARTNATKSCWFRPHHIVIYSALYSFFIVLWSKQKVNNKKLQKTKRDQITKQQKIRFLMLRNCRLNKKYEMDDTF